MKDYVRIVISDVHLGSKHSKECELYSFLQETYFDELIINGDFLDLLKGPIFSKTSFEIINYIIETNKKVIYIIGNHDIQLKNFIGMSLKNIEFRKEYSFDYAGRRYYIIHGDGYDTGLVHFTFAMKIVSVFQDFFENYFNIDIGSWWAGILNKKAKVKSFWNIVNSKLDTDVCIVGHNHRPEVLIWVDKHSNIKTYANTGDWLCNNTYIEIKDDRLRLKKYYKDKQMEDEYR